VGLKLNGTHQRLVYADDVNQLGDNISAIKKNTEHVIDASNEVGPEVNTGKYVYKYMLISPDQNIGQNHYLNIAHRSFERM
jgi:hypothetical protein